MFPYVSHVIFGGFLFPTNPAELYRMYPVSVPNSIDSWLNPLGQRTGNAPGREITLTLTTGGTPGFADEK